MLSPEFLITSLIVVLIPGTGVLFTVSIGLLKGWRASIFAALGCTAGIIPHLLASAMGLAALLHMSAVVFQLLKFLGAAYLLYLAWRMWHDSGALRFDSQRGSCGGNAEIASKAFLINILNPKLSIFFLAFLPQFVASDAESALSEMLLLGVVFMGMTFGVFIAYGFLANGVRTYVSNSPTLLRRVHRTFAAMFALLGAKLAMAER